MKILYYKLFVLLMPVILITHSNAYALEDGYKKKRAAMVDQQIKQRGITDPRILSAMRKIERHIFVSHPMKIFAYEDRPLSIGYKQTISQPYIVAYMTEAIALESDDRVLEIGTGSGYQAAVLAEIVKQVYSVEIVKPLADIARRRLLDLGYDNIMVKQGDGYKGWLEYAPFDKIVVTAAPPEIPEELISQLKVGGKMIVPVGSIFQELYLITKTKEGYDVDPLLPVRFVPMIKGDRY